jgi:hypothetical protein
MGATTIEKYIEGMDEWDTVFDPGGKQEYTEAQMIRFAVGYAKHLSKCSCGKTKAEDGSCDGSHKETCV